MAFQRVTGSAGAQPAAAGGHLHRGSDARARSQQELQKQAEGSVARDNQRAAGVVNLQQVNRSRFRLQSGAMAEIIVLDASVDAAAFGYEHHMKGEDGKWTIFELCPKEYDHCPLCEKDRESSYTMYLTVLDLSGFTNREGVFVPHYKRLMAVKTNLHDEFFKLSDAAVREFGTMRGMHLLMERDGTVNSAIGRPVMMPDGTMYKMLSEEDLVAEFGHEEMRNEEGNLVKMANFDIAPYPYDRMFNRPSGEDLRRRYGAGAVAGSRSDTRAEWGGTQERQQGYTPPRTRSRTQMGYQPSQQRQEEAEPAAPPMRTRARVGAAPVAQQAQQAQPAEQAPAAPRTRTRTAPAQPTAAPASRVRRVTPQPTAATAGVPNDLDNEIPFD